MIKYKIACSETAFVRIVHINIRKTVTVQQLRMFLKLLYTERDYIVCALHNIVLDIAGESLSLTAYSIRSEVLLTGKPNS